MTAIISQQKQTRNRGRLFLLSCMAAATATPAFAQLAEAENTANWVLAIFSPALMLAFLTILLIGCGIAVYMGKISGGLFVKILVGSILIFGARTIAPRIVALF
jgi:type IV secretory pathway VirB2 component (pilin)